MVFYLLPAGDPALRFAGKPPTPEKLALVRHNLGLDQPWYAQYGKFVKAIVAGDEYGWPGLGYSYDSNMPIRDKIIERAPRTLSLIAGAAVIWLVTGVRIGVLSAIKRRTIVDRLAMGFALFGISAPVFWLGLMALCIFWNKLDLDGAAPATSPFTDDPRRVVLAPDPSLVRARPALLGDLRAHGRAATCSTRSARTTSARRAPRACPSAA